LADGRPEIADVVADLSVGDVKRVIFVEDHRQVESHSVVSSLLAETRRARDGVPFLTRKAEVGSEVACPAGRSTERDHSRGNIFCARNQEVPLFGVDAVIPSSAPLAALAAGHAVATRRHVVAVIAEEAV